jgi:hypothetical protein
MSHRHSQGVGVDGRWLTASNGAMLRRVRHWIRSSLANENIDLYVMAIAAFAFTILGATGVTSITVLLSMTLGVLAALSLSQIRSRRHVAQIAAAANSDPLSILLTDFPEDLARRRASASDVLYIGVSMRRTAPTSMMAFQRILSAGGRIRVLLVDPTDEAALREAFHRLGGSPDIDGLRSTILASLSALAALSTSAGGSLEVRVSPCVPAAGINAVDTTSREGLVVAQYYEYRTQGEPSPILHFSASDAYWYRHFLEEAERMWEDSIPWPLPVDVSVQRLPHPVFVEDFGPTLMPAIDNAGDLLITGVARNTLLTSQYKRFERKLLDGTSIRFLLIEPSSDAVRVAADRYYADRSPNILRGRIDHSLRLMAEMQRSTGGNLQVRLTTYPMAAGVIATNLSADSPRVSELFVEYFTFQAPGEPKFVLTSTDGWAFENLLGEAEALWASASELDLATRTPLPQ